MAINRAKLCYDKVSGMDFKSKNTWVFISIIWGLGVAMLFRKVCKGTGCIVIKSPELKTTEGVYKFDKECYKFKPQVAKCEKN